MDSPESSPHSPVDLPEHAGATGGAPGIDFEDDSIVDDAGELEFEDGAGEPDEERAGEVQEKRLDDGLPPPPPDEEIAKLRELLFSRELVLLERLSAVMDNPAVTTRKVSDVLAEAIHLRSGKDLHLNLALQPLVDEIVKKAFHSRRGDFVTVLSPLMGPTIRRSISESFNSMMGSFSKSVETAFSWKGLRWRLAALRSGKPFSEIVMLNTLVYRVEQIFFIHSKTGLVLSHIAGESVEAQDADMVSAMLTAIQDFVRDCFAGGKDEELHSLQMGEFTIYIESGASAYLACVVRGTPPADFHAQLRATLDLLHIEHADAFADFQGDNEPFKSSVPYLEACMSSHYVDDDKKAPLWAKMLPVLLVLALVAGIAYLYHGRREAAAEQAKIEAARNASNAAMHRAVDLLRAEPGLMVANVQEAPQPPWNVLVLKDPLARPPADVFREKGVDPRYFAARVVPFVSYDPSIVVRRVRNSIKPPDTVTMDFDEHGTLTFTGAAPMSWIVSTRDDARAIPGVERVDISGVRDPMMDRISAMVAEVEGAVIEFPLGKDAPAAADAAKLAKAVDTLVKLESITREMGFTASLTIYGHADSVGDARRNYEISQARAKTVASMLYARGSSMPVAIYGMGSQYPKGAADAGARGESQASRRIELRVHFSLSPSARAEMFHR